MSDGDKIAFHLMRKSVDNGDGIQEYFSYVTAAEIEADPTAWGPESSWSDEGPRFQLWRHSSLGRVGLFRYTNQVPAVGALNAFFSSDYDPAHGFVRQPNSDPVG